MMRITAAILAATAFVPMSAYAGMYGDPVMNLDAKDFKKAMATEHAAMVAFVAPWCGHCKTLGPEFTAAASSLSPLIPFYAIDCDAPANKPLCGEQGVQGFPTIKGFPRAGKGAAREYKGERKKGALVEYAKELVPDRVKKLRADEGADKVLTKFLEEKSGLPHALLIHPSAPSIPFLWKVLGHRLSSQMFLGYIRDTTSHDILTSLGIYDSADTTRDATRAVVWNVGADKPELIEFDGAMKFNALLEWLQGFIPGQTPKPSKEKKDSNTDKANAKKAEKALKAEAKREGAGSGAGPGTGTDDAPKAEPVPVAEEGLMKDVNGGLPADPVPEEDAGAGEGGAAGAAKTGSHEEL